MNRTATRITAAACGTLLFTGLAATAASAEDEQGTGNVDVSVQIDPIRTPGVLAMSVAANTTTLIETGSNNTGRVFTGQLPTVTVTDTRIAEEIPDGAYWYVVGTASDFTTAGGSVIGAENIGWTPRLIDGGESGLVAEGDPVKPELDGGPGLVDRELLALALDSEAVAGDGSWTAAAGLTLKTPTSVQAGSYHGTLTLSLFE